MKKQLGITIWFIASLCMGSPPVADEYWQDTALEIDQLVEFHLKAAGKTFAPEVLDDVFLRRSYLSISGRIPYLNEIDAFFANPETSRREDLIAELFASPGYESHMFNFWADLLRLKENLPGLKQGGLPYVQWVKIQIHENTPYDEMIQEMITSHGDTWNKNEGATGFYRRDAGMPLDHFALTMQTFSGIQLQCAQCHNHPFESWTQKEFFEMAAFLNMRQNVFSEKAFDVKKVRQHFKGQLKADGPTSVTLKSTYNSLKDILGKSIPDEGKGVVRLPKDYQYSNAKPKGLIKARTVMGEEILFDPKTSEKNSREVFAQWLTSPDHQYFTRVIVNRLWKRVMGLGLYEPLDDIREDTVIDNEALMAYLEEQLIHLDYDLKAFLKLLHHSSVFSRESQFYAQGSSEPYLFEGPIMRRMSAEQLWDSLMTLKKEGLDGLKVPERKGFYSSYNLLSQMDQEQVIEFVEGLVETQSETGYRRGAVLKKIAALSAGVELSRSDFEDPMLMSMSPEDQMNSLYNDQPEAIVTLKKHPKTQRLIHSYRAQMMKHKKNKRNKEAQQSRELAIAEAAKIGLSEKDLKVCFEYYKRINRAKTKKIKYARASELGSPAPKGHFLRIFGASDREFIDNASLEGSTPQALEMMNGFVHWGVINDKKSVLMRGVENLSAAEAVDYLYRVLLTRSPTETERSYLAPFIENPSWNTKRDMVWAIANGPEFSFIY